MAVDGYGSHGVCWASTLEASQAVCSHAYPAVEAGEVATCIGVGDGYVDVRLASASTGSSMDFTVPLTFGGCDMDVWQAQNPFGLTLGDGGLIASSIAGVWAMAWAFTALRRVLGGGGMPSDEE